MNKIHFTIPLGDDGATFEGLAVGSTWEEVVRDAKEQAVPIVGKKLGFLAKMWVRKSSPLKFGQRVVVTYNDRGNANYPIPKSCEEFVRWAIDLGIAKEI